MSEASCSQPSVVLGTAGHIDHGKTALIRALTGRDTDRLAEEKRRGITIDLGFTYFDLPGGERAGIIDVPGHERFIRNMTAGVPGMDLVLLVIAADEGIMPQTREHMDILELLGVKQSFVRIGYALRKIDDGKLYEQDGYKSVAEFAKAEYGLEASTVSRFMSINREYSIDGYSERLREEYLDLSRSQLEEMLKLPEPDRQMITPETPREDIRDLKRFNREEPVPGVADDLHGLIEEFFRAHPEELNEIFAEEHPEGIKWLSSTSRSIEEISATIMAELNLHNAHKID